MIICAHSEKIAIQCCFRSTSRLRFATAVPCLRRKCAPVLGAVQRAIVAPNGFAIVLWEEKLDDANLDPLMAIRRIV